MSHSNGDYVRVPLSGVLDNSDDYNINGGSDNQSANPATESSPGLFSIERYQQYFDVDTTQVLQRLLHAVIPNPRNSFVANTLKPRADLYGPFWVATTLVLASAIGGNIADYLQFRGTSKWHYDFHKVSLASLIIYVYWLLVPLGFYVFFYFRRNAVNEDSQEELINERNTSMIESNFWDILSLYGYSLTIFIPVTILWTVQSSVLQWIVGILGMAISSSVLVISLVPLFKRHQSLLVTPLTIVTVILHCMFTFTLMVTFFYESPVHQSIADPNAVPILT